MIKVILNINSTQWHFSQIITGFLVLQKDGIVDLKFRYGKFRMWANIMEGTIDNIPVAYDLSDSSTINESIYEKVNVYFKRCCLKSDRKTHIKLQPLGFNYLGYTKGWDYFKIYSRVLPWFSKLALQRIRYLPILPAFINLEDSINSSHYQIFEGSNTDRKFIIQFSSRLWNHQVNHNAAWGEERKRINYERIELARRLRAEFEGIYFGGVQDSAVSRELAPDLIIDKKNYEKKNYIQSLKDSSIGIVTPGLEDSIAWKFGEYVVAGLAILCTPEFLKYDLPGDFHEGKNFLVFRSDDECIEKIKMLQLDKDKLKKLIKTNIQYYQEYLRPDKLCYRTVLISKNSVVEEIR